MDASLNRKLEPAEPEIANFSDLRTGSAWAQAAAGAGTIELCPWSHQAALGECLQPIIEGRLTWLHRACGQAHRLHVLHLPPVLNL